MGSLRGTWWRSLWYILGMVMLVMGIAVLVIEFMSWNFLKPTISQQVESATGRELHIDGDIGVDLFPRPHVSVSELALANPDWASSGYMTKVESLSVTPALFPLLFGEIVLDEVMIEGAAVNLEARAKGSGNWVFNPPSGPAPEETPTTDDDAASDTLPVTIRHLDIQDATINYLPAGAGDPLVVAIPSLEVNSDDEAVDAEARVVFLGRRFTLEADADPLNDWLKGRADVGGNLRIASSDSHLKAFIKQPGSDSTENLHGHIEMRLADPTAWSKWLGGPEVELDELTATTDFEWHANRWQFQDLSFSADDSQFKGRLALYTGQAPQTFDARIIADKLSVKDLLDVFPGEDPQANGSKPVSRSSSAGLQLPVFPSVTGELEVGVKQLSFEQAALTDIQADLRLADRTLKVDSLKFDSGEGTVTGSGSFTSAPETLAAEMNLTVRSLGLAPFTGGGNLSGVMDSDMDISLGPFMREDNINPETLLSELQIGQALFSYEDTQSDIDLQAEINLEDETNAPTVRMNGRYDSKPFQVLVEGDPLHSVLDGSEYKLGLQADSGDLDARINTNLASLTSPKTMTATVELHEEGSDNLESWVGFTLPPISSFSIQADLERNQEVWTANQLSLELGDTRLNGILRFHNLEQPLVEVELEGKSIDLNPFLTGNDNPDRGVSTSQEDSPPSTLAESLALVDLQLVLQSETLFLPQGREFHDLVLIAQLEGGRLNIEPLQLDIGDGSLEANAVLDASDQPATGQLDARIANARLGRLSDSFLAVDERLGELSGELHVNAVEASADEAGQDVVLPSLGRLSFDESTLHFSNSEAQTDLRLRVRTEGLDTADQSFHVLGHGRYDGEPFSLQLWSDPILDIRNPQQPYSVGLSAEIVETNLSLEGSIERPLAVKGLDLELAVNGPNTERLERLLGLPMPDSPPYSIAGSLALNDSQWTLGNIEGLVGTSDLNGHLAMEVGTSTPKITGELYSESMDLEDLGSSLGADPDTDTTGAHPAPPPPSEPEAAAENRFVLPDKPVVGKNLDQVSVDLSYEGRSVRVADIPLSDLSIDLNLENGRLHLNPVSFGVGEGEVNLIVTLDSTTSPPEGTVATEVRRVDLREALNEWDLAEDSVGIIGGRGKFWIQGVSISDLFASADGGLVLLMTQGRLDATLVELAGLDITEAIYTWLSDDIEVPINCAYVDVKAEDGVATLDTAVIDSEDSILTAGGNVDFNTEQLDISFLAHPKDFSLITARTPLHLGGTFADIKPGLHGSALSLRLATSLTLSTIAAPIAALVPMLEAGASEDTGYCQGLVGRLRSAMQEQGDEE